MLVFSPTEALVGGGLLFLSSSYFLHINGKIMGISGIVEDVFHKIGHKRLMAMASLLGMSTGAIIANNIFPASTPTDIGLSSSAIGLALGGMLVGFGTRLGMGCTSGHMLCGLSRFSPRSIVASSTFLGSAMLTSYLFKTSPRQHVAYASPIFNLQPSLHILTIALFNFELLRNIAQLKLYRTTLHLLTSFFSGLWFCVGLYMSGMVNPLKVLAFLDITSIGTSAFDPSLLMVVAAGLIPKTLTYHLYIKNKESVLNGKLDIPTSRRIDWKLILGSLVFGIGWGGWGICPGPMWVNLTLGNGWPFAAGWWIGMEGARAIRG